MLLTRLRRYLAIDHAQQQQKHRNADRNLVKTENWKGLDGGSLMVTLEMVV